MSLHIHLAEIDTQISAFARAIALPIRVFILRMIAMNGNSLSKDAIVTTAYNAKTLNKHLLELRSLGIIKAKTVKAQVTYYIDEKLFGEMSANFSLFFGQELLNPAGDADKPEDKAGVDTAPESVITHEHFGALIKWHRQELNLSQAALAEKIGIDRALLSRIEGGKKPFPENKLTLLAKAVYEPAENLTQAFIKFEAAPQRVTQV
ncbi:helix-turn-helix domain-containing protein [Mucilaginibacter pedocola]|uniref:HTH cro/C1-type domain-containing protein n=1 Tax=Mucilaginibacter pedocola TaxID=1792845 RepID=A0A1S9PI81_9SPHI|nr:helix-turn-helix transcriptional regulator [Mucilaginibacter pedocola]OOQ60663.1 hypothetical protein BC343_24005 [Mucilaginibacter pedocola]